MEAIDAHTRTGMHPHWDFNEQIFGSYDWTQEPTESLEELYRQRAQQLREKYDYLVLWYSSGADSNNVLQSFLDNGIFLDEVASFVNEAGSHDKNDFYMNGEIYNVAADLISKYQEKYPGLKHRIIDICQHTVDFFSRSNIVLDWKYSMNTIFNPNASVRGHLFRSVTDWQDLINAGKKVGFIWGLDKPRLNMSNEKYYFVFLDIVDNAVNPLWQMTRQPGEFNEFFYWTPDMPEIMIKQGHVVKNYLRTATASSPYMQNKSTGMGYKEIDGDKLWISTIGVNSLIYPKYIFNELNEFKPSALFWTPRDNWFYKLPAADTAYQTWETSLAGLWKDVPDYWKNDPADPKKAFKSCVSRPYFLE